MEVQGVCTEISREQKKGAVPPARCTRSSKEEDFLIDGCKGNCDAPLDGVGRRSCCGSGFDAPADLLGLTGRCCTISFEAPAPVPGGGSICPERPGASADAPATTVGGRMGYVGGRRTPLGGRRGCVGGRKTPLEVGPSISGCCCSSDFDAFKEETGSASCAGAALEVG
ncbi:hypothetical protein Cgig2_017160 [Carnegiea gigantea]|uniref:Uncharacterized protein n=1 Tax=Carnegiea gigantea TaxID=171969 RepID=A0A9Q1QC91_9CARY|nr:hypothetical protein Cgig2_017160 [Carnegiea gigantea]